MTIIFCNIVLKDENKVHYCQSLSFLLHRSSLPASSSYRLGTIQSRLSYGSWIGVFNLQHRIILKWMIHIYITASDQDMSSHLSLFRIIYKLRTIGCTVTVSQCGRNVDSSLCGCCTAIIKTRDHWQFSVYFCGFNITAVISPRSAPLSAQLTYCTRRARLEPIRLNHDLVSFSEP